NSLERDPPSSHAHTTDSYDSYSYTSSSHVEPDDRQRRNPTNTNSTQHSLSHSSPPQTLTAEQYPPSITDEQHSTGQRQSTRLITETSHLSQTHPTIPSASTINPTLPDL
ncbi:hypothetical protein ADUPG1_005061, partial [Aduncisulcus paluster]